MSCGPAAGLLELVEVYDDVEAEFDAMIGDVLGQVGNIEAQAAAQVDKLTEKLKGFLPEIDIPFIPDSLQGDITSVVEGILTAQLAAEDLVGELGRLEDKWGGLDLGDISITDIPRLLKNGALDLERICEIIPNFEKDGAEITLKGTPISFPEINVPDLIKGGSIPRMTKPDFRVIVNRRVKNAGNKFANIVVPGLYRG